MRFYVGTSGYSFNEWKGSFYPTDLPQKEMLSYYAERFSAVEINNTFYRMPTAGMLKPWVKQAPDSFRFVLKAPQTITHRKRLKDCKAETTRLIRAAGALKGRLGPVLFQLPGNFKKDVPRLNDFLRSIKKRVAVAFEFRHESWLDDETFDCLRANSSALCIADVDAARSPRLVRTADWGYLRLRRKSYTKARLVKWIESLRSQGWDKAYVFFKHEETGTGPKLATRFLKLAEE